MRQLAILALLAAVAASGCRWADTPELRAQVSDVESVERDVFPLIDELGVITYWVDDRCRHIEYERGSFSNEPGPYGLCSVAEHPDPAAFDDEADRDLDRLVAAIRDSGVPIEYFSIERSADDETVGRYSFFDFGPCNYLHYWPGYPASLLAAAEPGEVRASLTDDWYESAC